MSGIQNIIARETTTDRDRERGRLNQHSDVVNRECWLRPTGSSPGAQNSTPTSAIFSSPRRVRPWCRLRRLEELSTRVAEQLDASRARSKLARKSSARGRTVGRLARVGPVQICTPSLGGQWLTGRARWACLNCPRLNPPGDSDERESRRYRPSLGRPLRTPSVVGHRPIRRGVVGAVSVASTVTPSRPSRRGRIGRGIGKVRKLPRIAYI